MSTLISVIVPVYNEEKNVRQAYTGIVGEFKKYTDIDYEIIFTDNHSVDQTFNELKKIAAQDSKVKVIRFVRNFGFQHSILTGYRNAKGDAAIQIDCDLQDPPELFGEFIRLWREGYDVVIGLRNKRLKNQLKIHFYLRKIYYRLLNIISDSPHEQGAGDFRLVDRHILDQLRIIDDAQPYVRGLISALARNQIGIEYERNVRQHGKSKFPVRQLFKMAFDGIYTHSTVPLRIATYLGIFIAFCTVILIVFYLVMKIFWGRHWPQGFATTTMLMLLGISLNAMFFGIIGEYIGRIYNQIRGKPRVVVEKCLNVTHQTIHS